MPLQKVGTRITQGRVQGRRAAIVGAVVVANVALLAACSTPTGDVASTAKSTPTDVAVAPPPSPPPPPAAPEQAADAEVGQAIVVTGSRVTPRNMASAAPVASVSTERRSRAGAVRQEIYAPPVVVPIDPGRERYDGEEISPVKLTSAEPVSTFSVDVDTGAYANTRRFLRQGAVPPRDAVRTEEMINYFRYDYERPTGRNTPFTTNIDVAKTPWNEDTYLMRVGLRGYDIARDERPSSNLVFLMDVSGSMGRPDKLPLVKTALSGLAGELGENDKVSIVVYAGAAGLVLEPTNSTAEIRRALNQLNAGGSTAGGAGIELAYNIAEDNFIKGGVNRVILATDGDFNVGVSDRDALVEMIEKNRDRGITLTTLGFGSGNYNEALMEQIANHGNGNYAYIDSALEAKKVLGDEMSSTLFTIAKDVKVQVEFNPAVISQYRLVGYENRALREEDFDNDAVDAGDIGAGHQVTAIYEVVPTGTKGWIAPRRYEDRPARAATDRIAEAAHVKLRYKLPNGSRSRLLERVVMSDAFERARAPRGDFAFAAAVAAYGQLLRGDDMMMGFSHEDVGALAGRQTNFWRQEFLELNALAASANPVQRGGG